MLGTRDGSTAADEARKDGFPPGATIFLDQEEGGRMLPEQQAYVYAWIDGVNSSEYRGGFIVPRFQREKPARWSLLQTICETRPAEDPSPSSSTMIRVLRRSVAPFQVIRRLRSKVASPSQRYGNSPSRLYEKN
jgi:hypothetical protein